MNQMYDDTCRRCKKYYDNCRKKFKKCFGRTENRLLSVQTLASARTNIVYRRGARTPRDAEKISVGSLSATLRLGVSAVKINEGASYPGDAPSRLRFHADPPFSFGGRAQLTTHPFILSIATHPSGVMPMISVATPRTSYVSKNFIRAIGWSTSPIKG